MTKSMRPVLAIISSILLINIFTACSRTIETESKNVSEPLQKKRANILLIVADDLGYSDLGTYGGEIETPNLDRLANEDGVKLTNFHVAPTCSPTRSMLMSGTYNHEAGLGAMAEWTADNQRGKPGYEGYLNEEVVSLPTLLQDAGYHTFMAGKWHLGMQPGQGPDARGFNSSFALLPGGGNHFSDQGLMSPRPVPYRENGKPVKLPDNFYSTEFYTDKTIEYIEKSRSSDKPFFGYVAFTAPHWPLQVPEKYSEKYRGKYDSGYEQIKQDRFKKMLETGVISPQVTANPGSACYKSWDMLSVEEQQGEARLMEIYAGMVDSLDENIGRLFSYLKSIDEFENTLIVFISDNGADARPLRGMGQESSYLTTNYDNSIENWGTASSFVSYGGAWAEVGMTPFRLHKGMTTEGAIRAPAIIRYPGVNITSGVRHEFASAMDILPTFLEVAGVEHPGTQYKGRTVLPVTGKSMLPYLKGESDIVQQDLLYGFSVHSRQGLQFGEWKILRLPAPHGDSTWELYNIEQDPGETRNIANSNPEILKNMIKRWDSFAADTGIIISEEGTESPNECNATSANQSL